MGFEIERKFLVRCEDWQELAISQTPIRQAYLTIDGKASIRVRIKGEAAATLSIKSRGASLRRLEVEVALPILEAEALMPLRQGSVIEKVRHVIPWDDLAWEIDVFSGENIGLIIAEIELRHEHQNFELPRWIGAEVTGQTQYYNSITIVLWRSARLARGRTGTDRQRWNRGRKSRAYIAPRPARSLPSVRSRPRPCALAFSRPTGRLLERTELQEMLGS